MSALLCFFSVGFLPSAATGKAAAATVLVAAADLVAAAGLAAVVGRARGWMLEAGGLKREVLSLISVKIVLFCT